MEGTGAITEYVNVAQVTLYAFWLFLAGLIFYLRLEDKREGYPLLAEANESTGRKAEQKDGFPAPPKPKIFKLADGRSIEVPRREKVDYELRAEPTEAWDGAPLEPTGNPMLDGLGPAAWAQRENTPEKTTRGDLKIVPLRVARDFSVAAEDPDPRGFAVIGCDGKQGARVRDIWVDRGEMRFMYLEGEVAGGDRVMIPYNFSVVTTDGLVKVNSITSDQFYYVPRLSNPDQITPQEEDRICAYFGGGTLYAVPGRTEPFL